MLGKMIFFENRQTYLLKNVRSHACIRVYAYELTLYVSSLEIVLPCILCQNVILAFILYILLSFILLASDFYVYVDYNTDV